VLSRTGYSAPGAESEFPETVPSIDAPLLPPLALVRLGGTGALVHGHPLILERYHLQEVKREPLKKILAQIKCGFSIFTRRSKKLLQIDAYSV
jgi:hypothetical protein